jgi:ABC-type phosphate transport system substrate-binding protein
MTTFTRLVTAALAATAAASLVLTTPALADPPVRPRACDIVGVGASTTAFLFDQFSVNYNAPILAAHPGGQTESCARFPTSFLYSWDATGSPSIVPKQGCEPIPRDAGIAALADKSRIPTGEICVDFVRSARARRSTDPLTVSFVALARDNVTYASVVRGSHAPGNLTTHQLNEIYTCRVTRWNQVGGHSAAKIHPLLPQAGSSIGAFFDAVIGITTPGSCVTEPSTLVEDEGTDRIFTGPNAPNEIIPFSAGAWDAQAFHSARCLNSSCTACQKPTKGQNRFGCDVNGVLKLNDVNGTSPTSGKGARTVLNPKFTPAFVRLLFDVVRTAKTATRIPAYLVKILGPRSAGGFVCSARQAQMIVDYGFESTSLCGRAS